MRKPLLHLVFGGEVRNPRGHEFVNVEALDVVGIFPDYRSAVDAWRAASQARVDEANVKYVVVHLHRLLEPEARKPAKPRRRPRRPRAAKSKN